MEKLELFVFSVAAILAATVIISAVKGLAARPSLRWTLYEILLMPWCILLPAMIDRLSIILGLHDEILSIVAGVIVLPMGAFILYATISFIFFRYDGVDREVMGPYFNRLRLGLYLMIGVSMIAVGVFLLVGNISLPAWS